MSSLLALTADPAPSSSSTVNRPTAVAPQAEVGALTTVEANFSFRDFLGIINPLQHIPIVGSIYRAITGDVIAPAARVVGGALFGGPIGLMASVANAIMEQATGKDVGEQALALFSSDKSDKNSVPASSETAPGQLADIAVSSPSPAAPPAPWLAPTESEPRPVDVAPPGIVAALPAETPAMMVSSPQNQARAIPAAAAGRTLADYRSFAGQRLPSIDASRGGNAAQRTTMVPLQTSQPIGSDRVRPHTLATPKTELPAGAVVESVKAAEATREAENDWLASAMLRGLDRYREMKRQQAPAQPQVDTVL
jgi:hypothetical protein